MSNFGRVQGQGQSQFNDNSNFHSQQINSFQQQNNPQQFQVQQNSSGGQNFRSDNSSHMQSVAGNGGNDWDQFFQQQTSGVENSSNNSFLQNNKVDQYGNVALQNSTMNDGTGQYLRPQSNVRLPLQMSGSAAGGMSLEQSMKQALARTVGLAPPVGNGGINNDFYPHQQQLQQRGGGSGNMNNNMVSQQQLQGGQRSNILSGNSMQQHQQQIGGGSFNQQNVVRGGSNQLQMLQHQQQQQQQLSQRGSARDFGADLIGNSSSNNSGFINRSMNIGGDQYQLQQRGSDRDRYEDFDSGGAYDDRRGSSHGGSVSIAAGRSMGGTVADPLSVLNKLNSIVAVTGGGLSVAQMQRAQLNPAGNPVVRGGRGGGAGGFGGGLQQPMRNFHNNTVSMQGHQMSPITSPGSSHGGVYSGQQQSVSKRGAVSVEVLPGDVRYRGPSAVRGSTQVVSAMGQPRLLQHNGGGVGGGAGFVSNKAQQQAWQQQQQQGQRSGGDSGSTGGSGAAYVHQSFNSNLRTSGSASYNATTSSTIANQATNSYNNSGRISKWSAMPENPLDFHTGGNSASIRKPSKGGLSATPAHITNLNNLSFSGVSGSKRDRSPSPSYSNRSRSRSPSYRDGGRNSMDRYGDQSMTRSGRGVIDSGGRGGGRGMATVSGRGRGGPNTRSPPRGGGGRGGAIGVGSHTIPPHAQPQQQQQQYGLRHAREVDYATMTAHEISQIFNAPAIPCTLQTITATDLYSRFPNLYVPVDFMSVAVDWRSITASMYNDKIAELPTAVPLLFENLPTAMLATTADKSSAAPGAGDVVAAPLPSGLEHARYTYLSASTVNNTIIDQFSQYSTYSAVVAQRPVKFNAKVIVTCGVANHEAERIDHNLPRKLRIMCGRRKGQLMLLGSSWCEELDGGNPLEDRSCLLNTARRAVYAQSLLDIFNPPPPREEGQEQAEYDVTSNLTKLCEVSYHRPREELNGRLYPEQDEITAIYMYTLQPDSLPRAESDLTAAAWSLFSGRVQGRSVGPVINANVDQYHDSADYLDLVNGQVQPHSSVVAVHQVDDDKVESVTAAEVSAEVVNEAKEDQQESDITALEAVEGSSTVEMTIDREGGAPMVEGDISSNSIPAEVATESATQPIDTVVKITDTPAALTAELPPVGRQLDKPAVPSAFLCPTPLPKDVHEDNTRRQDAVSLRMLPLSAVLSYSPDDCSERIFEASLAAEFVRSLVATNSANIITDFMIAENPALACLADTRVIQAVKVLRKILATAKAKSAPTAVAVIESGAAPLQSPTFADTDQSSTNEAKDSSISEPHSGVADATAASIDGEAAPATRPVDVPVESESAVKHEHQLKLPLEPVEMKQDVLVNNTVEDLSPVTVAVPIVTEQEQQDHEPEVCAMSEDEARMWRRRFLAACRWFDPNQERVLPRDVIQLIIHSSTRNMSRADVASVADLVCKAGKVSYETFV